MDAIRQLSQNFSPGYVLANFKNFLSRKKMKSIKDETDQLYGIIHKFENATNEANRIANEVFFVLNSSFHSDQNPG